MVIDGATGRVPQFIMPMKSVSYKTNVLMNTNVFLNIAEILKYLFNYIISVFTLLVLPSITSFLN